MKMSNKIYDILKFIAQLVMPVGTFIGAVMVIWNIPHAEQITATFSALDVLIGAIVVASNSVYKKQSGVN